MKIANYCPISQPLEIIQQIINEKKENLSNFILKRFKEEILSDETIKLIPSFELMSGVPNYSMVKVSNAAIVQDCIEDEFYQPFIKTEGGLINSGLWTRSIYDPEEKLTENLIIDPDYNSLEVRKRFLAVCKTTGKYFIVAMYKELEENEEEWEKWRQETIKMNSLHEFIGIYEHCESFDEDAEKLDTLHLIKINEHVIDGLTSISDGDLIEIRSKLVDYLTSCLKGNKTAAESLMLWLVSRPSMRVDGLVDSLFIGKLAVNLCVSAGDDSEKSSAAELFKVLKGIKPFVAGPIEIESSPDGSFTKESIYPRLNVQSGRIDPNAILQQPDGCVLIIDEEKLSECEFKDQAVCNLQALLDLIIKQQVTYDFGMQQVSLKTDMPVVTISKGKKSILPFDLKIECETVEFKETSDSKLFLSYLNHCRMISCSVSEEMAVYLEQEYLSLRKSSPLLPNGNPKMNEQEFHRLMNLARLSAVSRGQTSLSKEIWDATKFLYY